MDSALISQTVTSDQYWGAWQRFGVCFGLRSHVRINPLSLAVRWGGGETTNRSSVKHWFDIAQRDAQLRDPQAFERCEGNCELTACGVTLATGTFAQVQTALDWQARLHLALNAPKHHFIHAGVVALRGKAIIIPGRSFTGKTTLVAALVAAGAQYLSDEYAVIDPFGMIHPFARPLSIRHEGGRRWKTAVQFGGSSATEPIPASHILLTGYHAGHEWRPQRISPAAALMGLFDNALVSTGRAPSCIESLALVVRQTVCLQGTRGDAGEVTRYLLSE